MSPREDRYTNTEADAGAYDRRYFAVPVDDKPSPSDLAEPEGRDEPDYDLAEGDEGR
jgi:hypothetical protein